MRAALARLHSTCSSPSRLLALLQRNPELGAADARAELRWMRDTARRPIPGSSSGHDAEAALEAMVQRRARGEPLQYILGTSASFASIPS